MPYARDEVFQLVMDVPAGYVVEELPKSSKVLLGDNIGFFEYIIQKDEDIIQFRSRIKIDKTIFSADSYNGLRDFFATIVNKQNEQIVFKKKK